MIPDLFYTTSELRPTFDLTSAEVEVWRDNDGAPCAYGQTVDSQHWMHIPRVGSFAFESESGSVEVVAEEGASPELVQDAYLRMVLPMVLQVSGQEVLHGSAVATSAGVLALCAVSETGKSTLAYDLSERGHPLWADDAVVFDASSPSVRVLPTPFAVRLRPASAEFFKQQYKDDTHTLCWEFPTRREPAPLAGLCVLERLPDSAPRPVEVVRLAPTEAFAAALPHAYCFSLRDPARKGRMMRQYLDLARRAPVFKVSFQAGLDKLGTILDAVEQAVLGVAV